MIKKLSIQSWVIVGLVVAVIALSLYVFLYKRTDAKQEVTKYEVEQLQNEIKNLTTKYQQDSIANVKREAEIEQRYEQKIVRLNKNVNKLYKQLYADIDTVRNLDPNDSFKFFSTWIPTED